MNLANEKEALQESINKIKLIVNNSPKDSLSSIDTIMDFYQNQIRKLTISEYLVYLISNYAKNLLQNNKLFTEKYLYSRIVFNDFYSLNISPFWFEYNEPFCKVDFRDKNFSFNQDIEKLDNYVKKVKEKGLFKIDINNKIIKVYNDKYLSKTNNQLRINYIKEIFTSKEEKIIKNILNFIFHDRKCLSNSNLNKIRKNIKKKITILKKENQDWNDKIIVSNKYLFKTKNYLQEFKNDLTTFYEAEGYTLVPSAYISDINLSQYITQIAIIDSYPQEKLLNGELILGINTADGKRFEMSNLLMSEKI